MLKYLFVDQSTSFGELKEQLHREIHKKFQRESENLVILKFYQEKNFRVHELNHEDERRLYQIFQDSADVTQLVLEIKNSGKPNMQPNFEQYYNQLSQKCEIKLTVDVSLRDYVRNFESLRSDDQTLVLDVSSTYTEVIEKIKEILKPELKHEIDYEKLYLLKKKKRHQF
jgi:hypothetical protein